VEVFKSKKGGGGEFDESGLVFKGSISSIFLRRWFVCHVFTGVEVLRRFDEN
jgi:hypothetical protein